MSKRRPVVAIVGRQNVGKSTLFNRLTEEARALTSPIPGTTRDRNRGTVLWRGASWTIEDTGGIEEAPADRIAESVRRLAERAVHEADAVCFVVDGQRGLTGEDRYIARLLRKARAPVILTVNKIDGTMDRERIPEEIGSLGFKHRVLLSAKNGTGTGDLIDLLHSMLPKPAHEDHDDIRLLLLGKPNVGKSSLINRLVGEERVIVSPTPHTTRDAQDTVMRFRGTTYRLIDTAGIRRQAKISKLSRSRNEEHLELLGVDAALRSLERADVAIVVLDATMPITSQDRRIVREVLSGRVGVVLVANKWDAVRGKDGASLFAFEKTVRASFPFLAWAPLLTVSAVTAQRVRDILTVSKTVADARSRRLTSDELAEFLRMMRARLSKGRTTRSKTVTLIHIEQTGVAPPQFHLMIGPRDHLSVYHERFLVNTLRERYAFTGTPIGVTIEQQLRT